MQAKRQLWQYSDNTKVWVGKYRNSQNMPHWHYDCELLTVVCGQLDISCNGAALNVGSGQTVFIDSEQVHYMHAVTPDTIAEVIIFNYDIIRPFASGLQLLSPLLDGQYNAANLYCELKEKLLERRSLYEYETALDVASFMLGVFRDERTEPKKANKADRFKALLSDIDERFEYYDIQSAADFLNINVAYFSRLFHEQMGITFSHYLNYVRAAKAVELLNSAEGLTMTDIAIKCGFTTIRSFNRIFKEYTGYAPKNMPKNYIMKESFSDMTAARRNPTLSECELLESSDGN